jgi:uncharacterized membrane protein YeiH
MEQTVILITELVGTVAFAFSGAMVGIEKRMDIFGVWLLAVITAVGGGMLRDLLLGNIPPVLFRNPLYVAVATLTALLVFLVVYFQRIPFRDRAAVKALYWKVINAFDAIGLGMFTVIGVNTAIQAGYGSNGFLMVSVGVVTGVGGGILRDVLAGVTPVVLYKRVYASASILGALVYVLLWRRIQGFVAMAVAAAVIILIRYLAARYRWNLPVADWGAKGEGTPKEKD